MAYNRIREAVHMDESDRKVRYLRALVAKKESQVSSERPVIYSVVLLQKGGKINWNQGITGCSHSFHSMYHACIQVRTTKERVVTVVHVVIDQG